MFKVVSSTTSEALGSIGYRERLWHDHPVFETGWSILSEYQGQGIATKAGEAMIEHARLQNRHPFMHAFPSVTDPASNAICRKLGFSLIETCEVECPPGHPLTVNDWRLDLFVSEAPGQR